jgi:polyferredoxin
LASELVIGANWFKKQKSNIKNKKEMFTSDIIFSLVPIFCGCILPIVIIWLLVREKMNETNARTQIVTAAIEKNPDMDIEELMKKMSPKQKLLKEKLLSKLLWGCITSVIGLGLIILAIYLKSSGTGIEDDFLTAISFGLILLAIGAAFIINYGVGKKMLAKELEAEQNNLTKQE